MSQLNVYINFNGNCREAMNFYKDCLGGELIIRNIGGSPMEAQCPAGMADQVLHSSLQKGDLVIMASDMTGPEGFQKGNNMSLSFNCSSEEELNTLFSKFSEGGNIICPLGDSFWGATFGVVNDKFGICWMFNHEKK